MMLEILRMLGISVLIAFGLIGYIFLLNFFVETPKHLAQIAKNLSSLYERTNFNGPRK